MKILGSNRQDDPGSSEISSRLLEERIVFATNLTDERSANQVIAQLLLLHREDPEKDISLYVNSQEGAPTLGLAVYDTMQALSCAVATVCLGVAAQAAALVLAGGAPGKRAALPHARINIGQPAASLIGKTVDIDLRVRELLRVRHRIDELLARHSGQPLERIERDTAQDLWLSAEEAKAYGLIDAVVSRVPLP